VNRFIVAAALVSIGCVNPPSIIMVDRATALEHQAGGSYPILENRLAHKSVAGQPLPITPDQLEMLARTTPPLVDRLDMTDADRIDDLLERHCVGEGADGSLIDTPDVCRGVTEHEDVLVLIDRANRGRAQLWRRLQEQRPGAALTDVRKDWHATHMRGVVCGGWIQSESGDWHEKPC
jgi:hypothetical protein